MDVASLTWLASRVRNFFYLSDPSVESFETVEQVTDYHTEVSGADNLIDYWSINGFWSVDDSLYIEEPYSALKPRTRI